MTADRSTPEDLINTVIAADALRREMMGMKPGRYKPGQRTWIEPWFNLPGRLFGMAMQSLPWRLRQPLDLWLCRKLGGVHPPEPNPELPSRIAQAVAMAQELKKSTGQWPAVLISTSHPETEGPLQWLRFELLHQAIQLADAIVEARTPRAWFHEHPRCFLAIDPYALDTVSIPVGAFYAAWMYQVYLAWDRQPSTQSWIQRHLLLRGSAYDRIGWRLIDQLKADVPVLMMLPGGLPHNARMLYGAREFVQRLQLRKWPIPKIAAANQLMQLLMKPVNGIRPAEKGGLPPETAVAVRQFLSSLGMAAGEVEAAFALFAEEFRLPVPYRGRLFNVLVNRLVMKGKPLMMVATAHRESAPHVGVSEPWGIYADSSGQIRVSIGDISRLAAGVPAENLGKSFVTANFNPI